MKIAIDGPVGAGKSTVADAVAGSLGILHLDTGAMYRAVGLTCLRQGVDINDEAAVTRCCDVVTIDVTHAADGQHTWADGVDVTGDLRTEEVGMAASRVGTYAGVRRAMVAAQQRLAEQTSMLLDGRDIGTRVLPDADVKIYLTASAEERARRRCEQMKEKGKEIPFEEVLADLKARDAQDMNREVDPLRAAEDAVIVDTTDLSFEESVAEILAIIRSRV